MQKRKIAKPKQEDCNKHKIKTTNINKNEETRTKKQKERGRNKENKSEYKRGHRKSTKTQSKQRNRRTLLCTPSWRRDMRAPPKVVRTACSWRWRRRKFVSTIEDGVVGLRGPYWDGPRLTLMSPRTYDNCLSQLRKNSRKNQSQIVN